MKKLLVVISMMFVLIGAAGCQSSTDSSAGVETKPDGISCKEILDDILTEVTDTNNDTKMYYEDEKYEEYFEYLYDTSYKRIDDGAFAYASSAYADEITVLHAAEADDVKTIVKHLEDRIDRRMTDFNGYKPEEVEKLGNAVIKTSGNYILMVVADNPEAVEDAFLKIVEQENK